MFLLIGRGGPGGGWKKKKMDKRGGKLIGVRNGAGGAV